MRERLKRACLQQAVWWKGGCGWCCFVSLQRKTREAPKERVFSLWEARPLGRHALMLCTMVQQSSFQPFRLTTQLLWIMQWKLPSRVTLTLEEELIPVQQEVSSVFCRARPYLWVKAEMPPDLQVPGNFLASQVLFLSPDGSTSAAEKQCLAALEEMMLAGAMLRNRAVWSTFSRCEHLWCFLAMISCWCVLEVSRGFSFGDSVVTSCFSFYLF